MNLTLSGMSSPDILKNSTFQYNASSGLNLTDSSSQSGSSDADIGRMINVIARPIIVLFGTIGKIIFNTYLELVLYEDLSIHFDLSIHS